MELAKTQEAMLNHNPKEWTQTNKGCWQGSARGDKGVNIQVGLLLKSGAGEQRDTGEDNQAGVKQELRPRDISVRFGLSLTRKRSYASQERNIY